MADTREVTLKLPAALLAAIDARVAPGAFRSRTELIRIVVGEWIARVAERAGALEAIRAKVRQSLEDPRPDLTEEEVAAGLERFIAARLGSRDEAA